jgi:hypothetical protein
MNWRILSAVVVTILCCCLVPGVVRTQPPIPPAVERPASSKYTMAITPSGDRYTIVVCDTQTGQCWTRYADGPKWHDHGSPSAKIVRAVAPK